MDRRSRNVLSLATLLALTVLLTPRSGEAQSNYAFERFWPVLPKAWYFDYPNDVAVGPTGIVWIVNVQFYRIEGFSEDGSLLRSIPLEDFASCLTVDAAGALYAGTSNGGLVSFEPNGELRWKIPPATFPQVLDVAADYAGNVYVCTTESKIFKYTQDGNQLAEWNINGRRILCDRDNHLYVIGQDGGGNTITKYDPAGNQLLQWGEQGAGPGQFNFPNDLALLAGGLIAVLDQENERIQTFTAAGAQSGVISLDDLEEPRYASKLAQSPITGALYITDSPEWLAGVSRLNADGDLLETWSAQGTDDGQLSWCGALAAAPDGRIFAADIKNDRVQAFTGAGQHLYTLDQLDSNIDIAVSGQNRLFVTDFYHDVFTVYDISGPVPVRLFDWPVAQAGLSDPFLTDIDVDQNERLYAVDFLAKTLYLFTPDIPNQTFALERVMNAGNSDFSGLADYLVDVEVRQADGAVLLADDRGAVAVFNAAGARIDTLDLQRLTSNSWVRRIETLSGGRLAVTGPRDGNFEDGGPEVTIYDADGAIIQQIGDRGGAPELFNIANGIAEDAQGNLYVADQRNSRIQKFAPQSAAADNRAVIVAAGGPFPGNALWDATQAAANFAYRTLAYQGFRKSNLYYLSSDLDLDLDNNGLFDDVDADAANANLQYALTEWAVGAENVVVYLVDHGGDGTFRMSGAQTLHESELAVWLQTLQSAIGGTLTVVYDACQSGSFLDALSAPGRIVIASAQANQNAYFLSQGAVSYSNFFWSHIFTGQSVAVSHALAAQSIADVIGNRQTPMLNDPSALAGVTYLGNGTELAGDAPVIGSVSPEQLIANASSATLSAFNVADADGIARVWATIRHPGYAAAAPDNPVVGLPAFELQPTGTPGEFAGTYADFTTPGAYLLAIYAADRLGNTSLPSLTSVVVESPLRRKAVVVAAGSPEDARWTAVATMAADAYQALRFQGYAAEDIAFLSADAKGAASALSLNALDGAFDALASQSVLDVVVYIAAASASDGAIRLNAAEVLPAAVFDAWLDDLQNALPAEGPVVIVADLDGSANLQAALAPPTGKRRATLTSADTPQTAAFLRGGALSFSGFFWNRIYNGATLFDAFAHSRLAIRAASRGQRAAINDSGNATPNEAVDGAWSRTYRIGAGVLLAGDEPLIATVAPPQNLSGSAAATIWIEGVTTTSQIAAVYATIQAPGLDGPGYYGPLAEPVVVALDHVGGSRYEALYEAFDRDGEYQIAVYAEDAKGGVSLPALTSVTQTAGIPGDPFEVDDAPGLASWIGVNGPAQRHTHHAANDEDWAAFYAEEGQFISIFTENLGPQADTVIEVFDAASPNAPLDACLGACQDDNSGLEGNGSSFLYFLPETSGYYLVRVTNAQGAAGGDTAYDLLVLEEVGGLQPGSVVGIVTDAETGAPIGGAAVLMPGMAKGAVSNASNGTYLIAAYVPGLHSMTVTAPGYADAVVTVTVPEGGVAQKNVALEPAGLPPSLAVDDADFTVGCAATEFNVAVRNDGGGVLDWQVQVVDGGDWLDAAQSAKTDGAGNIAVTCAANTAAAVRQARIRVTAAGAVPGQLDITVTQGGRGDIDGDLTFTAVDVQLAINAVLGLSGQTGNADVNGDGTTNAVDIQLVINAVLGVT